MFFDLHSHLLYGVDDGASSYAEMTQMLDIAYADGTRALCATPHYSPRLFGENRARATAVFEELCAYAEKKYPDLYLYQGHEIGYFGGCVEALNDGRCCSINGSRYVLVDFPEAMSFYEISSSLLMLIRVGYRPILAHTERYRALSSQLPWLHEFAANGGVIQLNASSACGEWGHGAKQLWRRLIKEDLAHIISSDGHHPEMRPPRMSVCMDYLQKHCSPHKIQQLIWNNACGVVGDEPIEI